MKQLKTLLFNNISTRQTFLKNASWYGLAQAVIQLFKFIIIPLSTRVLGSEQFGLYYYLLYLATAFYLFNDMGMPSYMVRTLNQSKTKLEENKTLGTFIKTRVVFVGVSLCISFFSFFVVEPQYWPHMALCIAVVGLDNFKKILMNVSVSLKRDETSSISSILSNIILLIGAFLVLKLSGSLLAYISIYVLYQGIELLLLIVMLRSHFPTFAGIGFSDSKAMLRASFPFFFTGALGIILQVTDTLLIKHMLDLSQVGFFQAVLKLTMALSIFYMLISRSIYPLLCGHVEEPDRFVNILRNGLSLASILAFPLLIGGMLLSDKIVIFMFTERFIPGIPAFRGLLVTLFVMFFLSVINQALSALHKEVQNARISFISVIINIGVSVALISPFGIAGVAYGTMIARLFDLICSFVILKRTMVTSFIDLVSVGKVMFAATVMSVVILYLLTFTLHVGILVCVGAGVYLIVLLLCRESQLSKFLYLFNKNVLTES